MAPSHMDYPHNVNAKVIESENEKYNMGCYKHKKFGKRISKDDVPPTAAPLFRPYALSENTPRKRRQELQQPHLQSQLHPQHQLPPTPPTTPPQLQPQQHFQTQVYPEYNYQQHLHQYQAPQFYVPTNTPTPTPTPTPVINHQALAYVLQKQRAVLQIRQMLSINPDANTWPTELRNALYSMM
ncbi:RNA-binding protein 33 [Drosophila sulfurigaster albostrigata]|uniref:RNA-binding protein 33 n=1 Tax=Drosophila sulfurigaster albostrigata TaxID=89887 RepID=UPI002D218EFA|nr:RNA-binding protein 33 [Drosophila sulfurigaster albostrigata]